MELVCGIDCGSRLIDDLINFLFVWTGYDVRICGQDVGRGTFSQRHCMLVDQKTSEIHIPLNDLRCPDGQGHLEVSSVLSRIPRIGL